MGPSRVHFVMHPAAAMTEARCLRAPGASSWGVGALLP